MILPGVAIAAVASSVATAQDKGTVDPKPLPPLAKPDDPKTPAKELFGRRVTAAPLQARSIGFYAKGCLAGAVAMPINGKTWQVMRLSRNRNWGHPALDGASWNSSPRKRQNSAGAGSWSATSRRRAAARC